MTSLPVPGTNDHLDESFRGYMRRSSSIRRLALSLVVGMAPIVWVGCDALAPRACTTEFVYGIVVSAIDRDTGQPVSDGLSGVTIRGAVATPMDLMGDRLYGAGEDAGVHAVVVRAPEYETWTMDRVEVEGGECHVTTVELTARLIPTSAI